MAPVAPKEKFPLRGRHNGSLGSWLNGFNMQCGTSDLKKQTNLGLEN